MTTLLTSFSGPKIARRIVGAVFQNETERFRCLATADETDGVFSMFEITVQPGGNAPMHRHLDEDETFFILEGRIAVFSENGRAEAGPGEMVHFGKGVPHAFRAIGDKPLRAVLLLHPGGTEVFYRKMCELVRDRADIKAFNELSMQHNIEIFGPCPE